MNQIVRDWLLAGIAALLIILAFVLAWSYALHVQRPIVETSAGYLDPRQAYAGGTVDMCRGLHFPRDTTLNISRSLSRTTPSGLTVTVAMGNTLVSRRAGQIHQCRPLAVPNIAPGVWTLNTYVEYKGWPFWSSTFEIEPLILEVLPTPINPDELYGLRE